MSDIAIQVEHLGKRYRIGELQRYKALRDTLTSALHAPFRAAASIAKGGRPRAKDPAGDNTMWALKDVSFEVKQGEVVGIIGRNGAGKSTLLKVLSRITEPTEGSAQMHGRVGSLLEVGTGFHPELTGRENIYLNGAILGMRKADINRKFDEIVAFAEVEKFIDTPVKHYSSGMFIRLAFAVAAHLEPEILLVDEVLAVGDAEFQKKCLGKMGEVAKEGRTILFVSHNLAAIQALCMRGILLNAGGLIYDGSSSGAVSEYERLAFVSSNNSLPLHVLFQSANQVPESAFEIVKIEILDREGNPKPSVHTWDSFTFRIHFRAQHGVHTGSIDIMLFSSSGESLMYLSTQPDSAVPMEIEVGENIVDCHVMQIPLSAGDYTIGVGLAIPNKEWLYKEENLGRLTIHARDVFGSGLAPVSSRSLLAVPHTWSIKGCEG